jgi:hypothetical protein
VIKRKNSIRERIKLLRKTSFWVVVLLSITMCVVESVRQNMATAFVSSVAWAVVNDAKAIDSRSRVIALRDYLRKNVTYDGAPVEERPFLRATASETLLSRKGYCGEVTRAFIRMAAAVGVRAQRINLFGKRMHVVAEAELSPGNNVIVDSQNPPHIEELENLDRVILRAEYDDYSTLNLRRLKLNWLVSRIKLNVGQLTYWTENPHALKAGLWLLLALSLISAKGFLMCARRFARYYLARNGWSQVSNKDDLGFAKVRVDGATYD